MKYKSFRDELVDSFVAPHFWVYLGWNDIRQRYRRSVLGPFWMVINTAIFVGMLGVLWSTLFKTRLDEYLPFFCVGYILWQFISSQITDCSAGFSQFEYVVKQIRLPFPVYVLRLLMRNFTIFVHNLLVLVVVLVIYSRTAVSFQGVFLALVGVVVLLVTLFSTSMIVALVCTRYKDMAMITQNTLMVAFYFTPILWKPQLLNEKYAWLANLNPAYVFIELVRAPLLGYPLSDVLLMTASAVFVLACISSYCLMAIARNKIAYWM